MHRRLFRRRWLVPVAVLLVAAIVIAVLALSSGGGQPATAGQASTVNTLPVDRGNLSDMVSAYGVLTYRGQSNGAPYAVVNHARGTYTKLPNAGDKIPCGGTLYRVNDHPVLLLCGATPAYRSLAEGDSGPDVAALNANLVHLGYASRAQLEPSSRHFTSATASALRKLQAQRGQSPTGALALGQAVFLPEQVRIARMYAELGGPAQPGMQVAQATSSALEVVVNLDPSQQREVKQGDRAEITLPDNTTITGKVDRLGRVAQVDNATTGATIPAYISLYQPHRAGALDQAPVHVAIATRGVKNALSIPVTAVVGRSGGGFAVEVVRADGTRELVTVKLGLFDTAGGRVQVDEGDLHAGERVVVPAS